MDVVVIEPRKGRHCAECRQGPLTPHIREYGSPLCLVCADLTHLVHLPRGFRGTHPPRPRGEFTLRGRGPLQPSPPEVRA